MVKPSSLFDVHSHRRLIAQAGEERKVKSKKVKGKSRVICFLLSFVASFEYCAEFKTDS